MSFKVKDFSDQTVREAEMEKAIGRTCLSLEFHFFFPVLASGLQRVGLSYKGIDLMKTPPPGEPQLSNTGEMFGR